MVLGFKGQFVSKIMDGYKIHTIREDKPNRWKAGNKIHFATGVRTSYYHQFKEGECVSTQDIHIVWLRVPYKKSIYEYPAIFIDNELLSVNEMALLLKHDGFDNKEEFYAWFSEDFTGKIIHWTDFKY